ncbi:LysR family transcriptional regulator [Lutispora sp.]|uniref:LysR family transcriptional regulator n=1 Tax=Lutispora sp. TaxID=2828727 RepID=UPI002B1EEBC9|nr:LysR family transcriptional regulator [Lutispora sp.]MEA4961594.1 LysR family transcriptional regulator [Lutispora sp.]
MDYDIIDTFLAIADTKSLSKAAELLFLSQSTVSYRLNALESEIGSQLVLREQGKRYVTLTNKGEEFVNIAKRWRSLYKDIAIWKTKKDIYELNIGSVDSLNTYILYELYKRAINIDNHLIINVSTHWTVTIYKMIENYEIDLGFVLWELPYKNIKCEPMFSERMVLISSSYSKLPKIINPADLDPEKGIFMYHGPKFQLWHDNIWRNRNIRFSTVDTVSLLISFMDIPDFWSIVPISVAKNLRKDNIIISEIKDPPPKRTCFKITNKNPIPNKVRSLESFSSLLDSFLKSEFFNCILEGE